MSTNAITLSHRLQIVNRFYGKPDEIHDNYDFVHCTNYWTSWDSELVLRPAALEALLTRELRYVGSKYPVCSLIRVRKFTARGWSINAGQIFEDGYAGQRIEPEEYYRPTGPTHGCGRSILHAGHLRA